MAARLRCVKCLKIVECEPYNPSILLNHIRIYHPDIELPDDDTMDNQAPVVPSFNLNHVLPDPIDELILPPPIDMNLKEETIRITNSNRKPMYTRKYKIHTPLTPRSPQKRRMYRTSIERWHPAKGTIYCPKCDANKRPIIRTRSEKMSYSTAGAACILTCWPLCFLPCLFPAAAKDYLHCGGCQNFLGMYDKQNNCVRPNREFLDGDGEVECPPNEAAIKVSDKENVFEKLLDVR